MELVAVNPPGTVNATSGESNLADLFCDALLSATKQDNLTVCFLNGGGFKKNINIGNIYQKDIDQAYPFNDTVVHLSITGDTLLNMLKIGVLAYPSGGPFPQVGNIRYSFLPLVSLQNPNKYDAVLVNAMITNGSQLYGIGGNGTVTLVTSSYIASGSDGYSLLKTAKVLYTSKTKVTTLVGKFIQDVVSPNPVGTVTDGRIVNCNGQASNPLCVSGGYSSGNGNSMATSPGTRRRIVPLYLCCFLILGFLFF